MSLTAVELPITPDVDPNKPTLEEAMQRVAEELEGRSEPSSQERLLAMASTTGNFADALSAEYLATLGLECVEGYERDKRDRKEWEDTVKRALESATQAKNGVEKNYPWKGASNIKFPLLTPAALQFNARMYPAVVKGDEAVLCKVIGQDNGRPMMGPDGQPVVVFQGMPIIPTPQGPLVMTPQGPQPLPEGAEPEIAWQVPPGAKAKRARRVSEYLNTTIFYRMQDWEDDTDALLMQLPIVGCVFRKLWFDAQAGEQRASMVSALRVFVPEGAKSCATTPRLTEEIPDVYPYQISQSIRSGHYSDVDLYGGDKDGKTEEKDGARLLLEQHRLIDLDGDGLDEPYIVTIDHQTAKVLRIEANFGPEDIKVGGDGRVMSIQRGKFYVKYDLFPHPEGKFYGIGLGHLLEQCGDIIDTAINQLMDAGHAQTAGGGFIGSGVRLQARGGSSTVRMVPGEYKTVDVPGNAIREAIVERTLPNVSPVTFQVLDLILGVAKDISGAKDVITGEASNNGQVGTTLALIEQGLQVFNATAKRVFRSFKEEFTLLKENIRKYGGEQAAEDYLTVLDDPEADFEADFSSRDMDIRPVSDPSSVTRMQKMAKSQFVMSTMEPLAMVGGDPREALRRAYEAADIEDIDKLLPPPKPQQPNPKDMADAQGAEAKAMRDMAAAGKDQAQTEALQFDTQAKAFAMGQQIGMVA